MAPEGPICSHKAVMDATWCGRHWLVRSLQKILCNAMRALPTRWLPNSMAALCWFETLKVAKTPGGPMSHEVSDLTVATKCGSHLLAYILQLPSLTQKASGNDLPVSLAVLV